MILASLQIKVALGSSEIQADFKSHKPVEVFAERSSEDPAYDATIAVYEQLAGEPDSNMLWNCVSKTMDAYFELNPP